MSRGLLIALVVIALLVPVSQGSSWGWTSARTLGLFALAVVLIPLWVRVESRNRSPLVDMQMMRLRPVWTTNLAAFLRKVVLQLCSPSEGARRLAERECDLALLPVAALARQGDLVAVPGVCIGARRKMASSSPIAFCVNP